MKLRMRLYLLRTTATLLQYDCNAIAILLQHYCNITATLLQHYCNMKSKLMQHLHQATATTAGEAMKRRMRLFLLQTTTTLLQHYCNTTPLCRVIFCNTGTKLLQLLHETTWGPVCDSICCELLQHYCNTYTMLLQLLQETIWSPVCDSIYCRVLPTFASYCNCQVCAAVCCSVLHRVFDSMCCRVLSAFAFYCNCQVACCSVLQRVGRCDSRCCRPLPAIAS